MRRKRHPRRLRPRLSRHAGDGCLTELQAGAPRQQPAHHQGVLPTGDDGRSARGAGPVMISYRISCTVCSSVCSRTSTERSSRRRTEQDGRARPAEGLRKVRAPSTGAGQAATVPAGRSTGLREIVWLLRSREGLLAVPWTRHDAARSGSRSSQAREGRKTRRCWPRFEMRSDGSGAGRFRRAMFDEPCAPLWRSRVIILRSAQ